VTPLVSSGEKDDMDVEVEELVQVEFTWEKLGEITI